MEEVKKVNAPHKKWLIITIIGIVLETIFGILGYVFFSISKLEGVENPLYGKTGELIAAIMLVLALFCMAGYVVTMHKLIRVWKVERVVTGKAQPKVVAPQPVKAKKWRTATFALSGAHFVTLIVLALAALEVIKIGKSSVQDSFVIILLIVNLIILVVGIVAGHKFILNARVVKTVPTENK